MKRLHLVSYFVLLSSFIEAGCSNTVKGSGGSAASSTSATSTASTGSKMSTTSTTSTASSMSTTSTGTGVIACGNETCGAGQFCNDTSGGCGKGPAAGLHCVTRGTVCSDGQAACGCDGKVYMSQSCASLAGVGIDASNKCPAPPSGFFCGGIACLGNMFYCQEIAHPDQPPGTPTDYSCRDLPAACNGTATCGCLDTCGSGPQPPPCTIDGSGDATQHCFTG